ncbi:MULTISPECIES: helix-turn-helix domain-containing protein [Yersinia]|uniref:helix-turn-helix domain-containing protein n=1 Tax=Yersinia TaxID=629 RepID=UPI0020BDBFC2|nr:helix-turn-helix transcriptional regulator [Yersinia ruckeri]EKN4095597.1 helix-turn-helix transcriptional regulator [Yersinia enterocolitica]EKN4849902.1 helix-turn-helix transcriptional regulator [Yersinia enterocolitica]EKN5121563.1 XRE family transcriptional regulator [Yersinia enterocolitica]MCK8560489.1 helix-turn-helix domain-containing protein [Yersinia ruckeri]HDL7127171.1 helix-turn-helix transcriptional regulator [Yersinia enterocolitica]
MQKNPIPERLRQARKKAGISQKDLGVKAGMDEGSASGRMNHYEKGRHVPDIETLRKIGTILNVPLSYFFCEDELSAEMVTLFQDLNENEKNNIIQILRGDKK